MRIFCTLLGLIAGLVAAPGLFAQDVAGTIKSLRGDTTLERMGQRRPAKVGETIMVRDRIRTGADGQVAVGLTDQTLLSLGPNADVDLSRYAFNATTHQGEQQVRVRSGSLAAISGKVAKASPDAVQFNAGTVTLGVRGTQFVIETRPAPEPGTVSGWTDASGQGVRTSDGRCWQTSSAQPGARSECDPDRFVLLPDRDGQVGRLALTTPDGQVVVQTPYAGAELGGRALRPVVLSESEVRSRYAGLLSALPPQARSFTVRFATGSATQLTEESEGVLQQLRTILRDWPVAPDVDVVGHTDTEGEAERNDALSVERARAVAARLGADLVAPERFRISGRGERQLLVPTPDNTPEPRNRRVEITVY